ncbi:MAG: hypothetical protein Q4G10_01010 [Bacteroidia bacterium]|nr:hypothetical protein [Bacteroidia bacterium]
MASLSDLLAQTVASAASNVQIPANAKNTVLNGLSESILGSLTKTATSAGGMDVLKNLFSGKQSAAQSPVTALAGKLFANNILSKLGLSSSQNSALSGLIPTIVGKLSGLIKDMDGDGDVDLQDILLALSGASPKKSNAGSILGSAATSILGSILGGKR